MLCLAIKICSNSFDECVDLFAVNGLSVCTEAGKFEYCDIASSCSLFVRCWVGYRYLNIAAVALEIVPIFMTSDRKPEGDNNKRG